MKKRRLDPQKAASILAKQARNRIYVPLRMPVTDGAGNPAGSVEVHPDGSVYLRAPKSAKTGPRLVRVRDPNTAAEFRELVFAQRRSQAAN